MTAMTILSVFVMISACAPQRKTYVSIIDAGSTLTAANTANAGDSDDNDSAADKSSTVDKPIVSSRRLKLGAR